MNILFWAIFGAIIGYIADMLDKSVQLTWLERLFVGIVGAVVGGTLATFFTTGALDLTASAGFDIISMIVAVIGALIALFIWKRLRPGGTTLG